MGRQIDQNGITIASGVSSADSTTILPLLVDPVTNWVLADAAPDTLTPTALAKCKIDSNQKETIYGISDTDGVTLIPIRTDTNGNLLAIF